MNNVHNLFNQTSNNVSSFINHNNLATAKAGLESNADIFFPVRQQPLTQLTNIADNGLQAIVREDTNEVLAVHGARYKLITNADIYGEIDTLIRNTPSLDTNGMVVQDQLAYAGGRTIRSYIFPEHKIQIGGDDKVNMKLNVVNSYDGSTNLRICMGGYRIVCANGMVVGDSFADYKSRHSNGFNQTEVAPRIAASFANFEKVGDQWKIWANQICTDDQAKLVIATITSSERLQETLFTFWLGERSKMGGSVWALYNALTFWSTHYKVKPSSAGNKAAIVMNREAKVITALRNPLFSQVA